MRLRIAAPCDRDWEEMTPGARGRLCDTCEREVYDLGRLSPAEADALLGAEGATPCVRLRRDARGDVVFRAQTCPSPGRSR